MAVILTESGLMSVADDYTGIPGVKKKKVYPKYKSSGGGSSSSSTPTPPPPKEEKIDLLKPVPDPTQSKENVISVASSTPQSSTTIGFGSALYGSARSFISGQGGSLKPFDFTVKPKGEQIAFYEPQFGTLTQDQPTGVREVTFRQREDEQLLRAGGQAGIARAREEKGLNKAFTDAQSRIDAGQTTVKEEQITTGILTDEANLRYQKEVTDIYGKLDLLGEKALGERRSGVRDVVDFAALANPLASSIGLAASSKDDPKVVDIAQIERGVSIEGATTSRPSARTATFAGGVLLGGGIKLFKAGNAVTAGAIDEARIGLNLNLGKQYNIGGGIKQEFSAKSIGGDSKGVFFAKQIGDKTIKVVGVQETNLVIPEYFTQRPIVLSDTSILAGQGKGILTKEGFDFTNMNLRATTQKEFSVVPTGIRGKGFKADFKQYTVNTDTRGGYLFGLSKEKGDLIIGIGGKPRLGLTVTRGSSETGTSFIAVEPELSFNVETGSIIKKVGGSGSSDSFISGGGGTGSILKTKKLKPFTSIGIEPPKLQLPKQQSVKTSFVSSRTDQVVSGKSFTSQTFQTPNLQQQVFKDELFKPAVITRTGGSSRGAAQQKTFSFAQPKLTTQTSILPRERVKVGQLTSQRLDQPLLQEQKLINPPPTIIKPPGFNPGFSFGDLGGGFIGFGLPILPKIPERSPGRSPKQKRKFKRSPSFAAVSLGITAFKPGKFEFTGITERPIIRKKKVKRRKKK